MSGDKSDWIYCRLVDRGNCILPRHEFWFGPFELCSFPESDERCATALRESMRWYAVSESGEGWKRLVRARLLLLGETPEEALRSGATHLREVVQLFNAHAFAPFARLRETEAGYLFNLRTRAARPLCPLPEERGMSGILATFDERTRHPQYILNMLLVTAPDVYGELGLAFRRCAHWLHLAREADDESERLLLNWMATECLAKVDQSDNVAPRLLAAVGLPTGRLWRKLDVADAAAIAATPKSQAWRKRLASLFDRLRHARNSIVHSGYRHIDLITLMSDEERACANDILPIATGCLSGMALMAVNQGRRTLREMWTAYPAALAPNGVVQRATWFLQRLEHLRSMTPFPS